MSFPHNAPPPTEGFTLLPEGWYDLQITDTEERKTKGGAPMVNVTCEVINNPEFNSKTVFYNVSFLPKDAKGAGMSSHFLKCINQPHEGEITVDPDAWIGEKFKARIGEREYENKDKKMVKTNDIKEVKADDQVPF